MNTLQKAFHHRSDHLHLWSRSGFIPAAGAASSTPSMCLLLQVLGINNYWLLSLLFRKGVIGWKGPAIFSPSLPITTIWNNFMNQRGRALFFTRFQFSIIYRSGTKNVKTDALSRLHASEETPEKELVATNASKPTPLGVHQVTLIFHALDVSL